MSSGRPTVFAISFVWIAALFFLVAPLRAANKPPTKADVSYGPSSNQLLDIYLPPEGKGPFPVVIWFGGLWKPGKGVPDLNHFFPFHCAAIAVQTRVMKEGQDLKAKAPVSVCLLDARRAVQFVRLHAADWNIDPNRIAVGGGSQGSLPALYVGCAGECADTKSSDPVERVSTKVVCVAAYRSQPSIDPRQMQEWAPGVEWGAPALGYSFAESLKRRDELQPLISQWSPDALLKEGDPPIYFEYNWGLTRPEAIKPTDYLVHSPAWGLGFQKLATAHHVTCYVKFPEHPTEKYSDIWDFLVEELGAKSGK